MDEERCSQIYIDQFYMELLRKELIVQIKSLTDITQQVIEYEIIVAWSKHYIIKQIGHRNEVTHSQYEPHAENTEQYPAQFVQMIPER